MKTFQNFFFLKDIVTRYFKSTSALKKDIQKFATKEEAVVKLAVLNKTQDEVEIIQISIPDTLFEGVK